MNPNKMKNYDPMLELDSRQWDLLSEDERVSAVMKFHQKAGIELPDENIHALLHVIVENQIVLGDETPVEAVLQRLIVESLDRHDAVHAIASILAEHMFELLRGEDTAPGNYEYYADLEKLTAEKWHRGDYTEG
jgi:hypothetical protein